MATVMRKSTGTSTSKSLTIAVWVIVALVIMVTIIAALFINGGSGAPQPATVNVSEQNANSDVQLHLGDRLVVTLDGNPTTGYTWDVASNDSTILKPIGAAQFTPATSALGSGGKVTRQFEGAGTGQTPFKMIYHRPAETGVAPAKTFELTVTVEK